MYSKALIMFLLFSVDGDGLDEELNYSEPGNYLDEILPAAEK